MNLFSKISRAASVLRAEFSPQSRDGGADETRTLPAHVAAWLGGADSAGTKLSDPYNLSPWVSSAIKHISGPIASVGVKFTVAGSKGDIEIDDAGLNAFWTKPGKGLSAKSRVSRYDFIEATVGWMCLEGEFFWILDDTWLAVRSSFRSPLVIARPDKMRPLLADGELVGWEYRDAANHAHHLIPEQVVSSKFWNPSNDLRGSAPMESARMAADADYAASRFWKSLAEANGDLGETIIAPNGITAEQEDQIRMILRRKRAAAKRGDYQPTFLVGDLKTEDAKIKSPDAASVTQRLQNRHEVYIAFGVPPSFAEVVASYSIGSASDRYKLIEETCMPMAAKIAEAVEVVSSKLLGRDVSAEFDFDDHSTMQQVRAERIAAGKTLHERGMPWNVVSDYLNLGLKPFAGWDKAWLPFNLQDVSNSEVPVSEPAPVVPPVDGGVKVFEELEALLKTPCCGGHGETRVTAPGPRWAKAMATRAPYVRKIRVAVDKALFAARKETLASIAAAEAEEKMLRSGAFDFIFDLANFLNALVTPVMAVLPEAYQAAGDEVLADDLGSSDPFIAADPKGLAWLRKRENFIKEAGGGMWEEVRNSLEEGIADGESFPKLAARVRDKFNDMSRSRAMRIAVTETNIAMGAGRHEGMLQGGTTHKEWLTSEDDRVRLTHQALDGKAIGVMEPFMVGGFPMQFPCDPEGPPGEIINCRCLEIPAGAPIEPGLDDVVGNDPAFGIPY